MLALSLVCTPTGTESLFFRLAENGDLTCRVNTDVVDCVRSKVPVANLLGAANIPVHYCTEGIGGEQLRSLHSTILTHACMPAHAHTHTRQRKAHLEVWQNCVHGVVVSVVSVCTQTLSKPMVG